MRLLQITVAAVLLLTSAALGQTKPFEFADTERIALIGNTFIERDQVYGYLETLLTTRFPTKNLSFRNMGWSGDTVAANVRAGSGPNHGVAGLLTLVKEFKPTIIIVGYGMNESFAGEPGLAKFIEGYNKLLDTLAPLKAKFILISPIAHEDLGRPFPDPTEHNKSLAMYTQAIGKIAAERGARFVDVFSPMMFLKGSWRLTDNGIHLTEQGYWQVAEMIGSGLGLPRLPMRIEMAGNDGGLRFDLRREVLHPVSPDALPLPPALVVSRLTPSVTYTLKIDGIEVASATGKQWERGQLLGKGPHFDRVDKLRDLINNKNIQFFNRYRPANDIYIYFGRKAEQGNNAKEMPQFEKFIAEREAEIAKLKVPVKHTYVLEPVK